MKLFDEFDVVSFDNLALEQLNVRRFFTEEKWKMFYQHEKSFYIDAANRTIAPSSRSTEILNWEAISFKDYFQSLN